MKRLYVSLSFDYLFSQKKSNGFFNQIQSLLHSFQIANALNRELVIDGFFLDFQDNVSVSLSRVLDTSTLPPFIDGFPPDQLVTRSRFLRDFRCPSTEKWLARIERYESTVENLFVGCCFYYRINTSLFLSDLKKLRFHPFFYSLLEPFLQQHPGFFAVHYRVESDFTSHFFSRFGFDSPTKMLDHLKKKYQEEIISLPTQDCPVLFLTSDVSSLPAFPSLYLDKTAFESEIRSHLESPKEKVPKMREVFALLDFLLGESSKKFIGLQESSFSQGIVNRREDKSSRLLSCST